MDSHEVLYDFVVTDIAATGWTGSNGEYSWGGSASTELIRAILAAQATPAFASLWRPNWQSCQFV